MALPESPRQRTEFAVDLCRAATSGFLAVASCDAKGRLRLAGAAGWQLEVASGSWPCADGDGMVVLATDPAMAPPCVPRLRVDDRDRLCLGTRLSRWLPEGPLTLVRYDPARRRLALMDVGLADEWIDSAVQRHGIERGWWNDDPDDERPDG